MPRSWRLRTDLQIVRLPAGGGVRVRDPLDQRCFQFSEEQWRALERLANFSDPKQWLRALVQREAEPESAAQGWLLFASQIAGEGLFRGGRDLRAQRRAKPAWWMSPLAIRLGGFPADRLTQFLYRYTNWMLHGVTVVTALLFVLLTTLIGLGYTWDLIAEATTELPWLLTNYPWLLPIALVSIKAMHELGHAITAWHVGGGCREIGVMLFVGSPCLYADVTECWMVPERLKRAAVTLAGSGIEAVFAAFAFWIWLGTGPGLLHALAWFVLIIVVLGNMLLNLNPLMRYDGYYLVSDLWGVPNLHQQAKEAALASWSRWLFGPDRHADTTSLSRQAGSELTATTVTHLPDESTSENDVAAARAHDAHQFRLTLFSMAAWTYRLFVMTVITGSLIWLATPYGLGWSAAALGVFWIMTSLLAPLAASVVQLNRLAMTSSRRIRGSLVLLVFMLSVLGLLLLPLPTRVGGWGTVRMSEAEALYAPESARTVATITEENAVEAGEILLQFQTDDLDWSIAHQEKLIRLTAARLEAARRTSSDQSLQTTNAMRSELKQLSEQLEVLKDRRDRLQLPAEQTGWLIAQHRTKPPRPTEDELPFWNGNPLHAVNREAWIDEGTLMGWYVPDQGKWEVWAQIDERDLPRVRAGSEVRIILMSQAARALQGYVVEVGLSSGHENVTGDETWADWLARISAGKAIDHRIAWVKIEASGVGRPGSALTDSQSLENVSEAANQKELVWLWHDEPARVWISVPNESIATRAWRWTSRQFHWAW